MERKKIAFWFSKAEDSIKKQINFWDKKLFRSFISLIWVLDSICSI